jgi:hypothetical protein
VAICDDLWSAATSSARLSSRRSGYELLHPAAIRDLPRAALFMAPVASPCSVALAERIGNECRNALSLRSALKLRMRARWRSEWQSSHSSVLLTSRCPARMPVNDQLVINQTPLHSAPKIHNNEEFR